MPRSSIVRALVITAVLALAAIAHSALATTWVAWVPVQTSAGTTATFGNYWGGASFMYSTQAVTWITPPMNTLGTATYDQIQNYLGTSGDNLAVGLSSYSASSNYIYSGSVGATATVAYASESTTVSTSYSGYMLLSVIDVSSETCVGEFLYYIYAYISAVGSAYSVVMFGNATWFYVTFYSQSFSSTGWQVIGGSFGSSTCVSPGYYLYVVAITLPGATTYVPNTELKYLNSATGAQNSLGAMYSLKISPAGGDTVVLPWTTSASPYVKLMFTQSVVNTAGSSALGSFNVVISGTTYSLTNIEYLLYFSDSATNTFPTGGQITPTNCPTNVYELPTTVSSSVTKLLSCQSLSSPTSGVAVYPGDYAKYTSTATTFIPFTIPSGASTTASFTVSYTDSASNTYSTTTGSTTQLSVYISSFSITPSVSGYVDYVHNPSITAGSTYYIPAPSTGWAYVGPEYLTSPSIGGATNVTVSLYALPSITAYPSVTLNTTTLRMPFSSSTTSYTIAFYNVGGDTETIGVTPNVFANTYLPINTTSYVVPSTASTATLYVPVASGGDVFVGELPLLWGGFSYKALVNVPLYALPSISAYPTLTLNNTLRYSYSSSVTSYAVYFTVNPGDTESIGITPNAFANTYLVINTTAYTVPSTATTATLYVPVASGTTYFYGYLSMEWNAFTYNAEISASLLGKPGISNYPTLTVNSTFRIPFGSSATSYTLYFAVKPGDTENLGITPNGLGVYFLSSNTTSYAIPSTSHQSALTIPTTTGVYIGQSLGDWWNVTDKPYYNLTLINGAGSTGSFTIKVNGISNTASQFAWNLNNPPNAIVYFTGTDGYTYAFNPSWVQGFGLTQALVGSSIYFVPTVVGKTLTSTHLAFIAQGTWLNETTVNNSFMTYYPLPSFINFLSTPIYMYVNGTTSPRYLVPALAIINNNLQQYTVQYMNITAWSNVGSLMGVAIISTPFAFIGFVSNGSLVPIWILLNSTAGVPPILFSYYPQIRYLLMPDTASVPYTLITIYVNVPSQLFNSWSGNLVFGVAQAMSNGYYALVSGGFYAPPPTQFSLYVPTYLLNKLAQLFLASYPLSSTCTMLQVLSNPLETTICQGISQVVNINLGNTQVGKPAFGDVPGAFNITPLTRNLTLEQVIAINAATAALVILFIKKHQSLPAGLMLGGAIALALGIFLWLEMEIGIGILLFVAGAALATTHRSQ